LAEELIALAAELYEFVNWSERLSARLKKQHHAEKLHAWAADLSKRFSEVQERTAHEISDAFAKTSDNLHAMVTELRQSSARLGQLRERWKLIGYDYEAIVAQIRRFRLRVPEHLTLRHIKPKNYARNLFHVANGVAAVAMYELLFDKPTLVVIGGVVLAAFLGMDLLRRVSPAFNEMFVKRTFGKISRPNEAHRVPAATWYLVALLIGLVVLPQPAIEIGVLVLALGDPAASIAGKRWGRRKLLGEKSLAGSIAFLLVSTAAGALFLWLTPHGVGGLHILWVALAAASAGTVAELGSYRLDDNFTVPLLAGGVAALLL